VNLRMRVVASWKLGVKESALAVLESELLQNYFVEVARLREARQAGRQAGRRASKQASRQSRPKKGGRADWAFLFLARSRPASPSELWHWPGIT
jgi:hypothetical protein